MLPYTPVIFKDDRIVELCRGKKVLHLGATDAPFHVERSKKKTLLHQRIEEVAKSLIGLDYDRKAISYLNSVGIDNIFFGDLIKGEYSPKISGKYDVIVMGDVIEHLDSPGTALENIKAFFKDNTRLVITCPNMHCIHTYRTFYTGREDVHPDHMYWPSYTTMKTMIERRGYIITRFNYCMWGKKDEYRGLRWFVYRILLKLRPYLASAMSFEVRLQRRK